VEKVITNIRYYIWRNFL